MPLSLHSVAGEILHRAKKVFGLNNFTKFFEGIYEYRKKNFKDSIDIFKNLELEKNEISKSVLRANILAKSYDQLKLYEKAFHFYEETNSILKKTYLNQVNKILIFLTDWFSFHLSSVGEQFCIL